MPENEFQKPNFDARLAYIDVLKNYLNTIAVCQIRRDYDNLMISLNSFYIYTAPFCKNRKDVQQNFIELKKIFFILKSNESESLNMRFDEKLTEFQVKLMDNIKYILMPIRGDETNDWDDFALQSDIPVTKK